MSEIHCDFLYSLKEMLGTPRWKLLLENSGVFKSEEKLSAPNRTKFSLHFKICCDIIFLLFREIICSKNKPSWKPEFMVLRQQTEWLQGMLNNMFYCITILFSCKIHNVNCLYTVFYFTVNEGCHHHQLWTHSLPALCHVYVSKGNKN
jgi:hypothetical protein